MALRSVEPNRDGIRTGPVRADGRAPARGQPVRTGKPWAVDSGEGALYHVIGVTLGSGWWCHGCIVQPQGSPKNENRAADDRLTSSSVRVGSTRTRVA
jgi:hypothetical protein